MLSNVIDEPIFESSDEDELSPEANEDNIAIASALAMAKLLLANTTIQGPGAKPRAIDPPVEDSSIVSPRDYAADLPAQPM